MAIRRGKVISFIGAGSPTFTPAIFSDICRTPQLSGSEILLYDIDPEKANTISAVCSRYAKLLGSDVRVTVVNKRLDAIKDSDFVINTALFNGWSQVENIRKQIAKDTGITIPVEAHAQFGQLNFLLSVAKDIEKTNPGATLIQCANPLSEGGTLINRETKVNFIGVCHGTKKFEQIGGLLGMKIEEMNAEIAGINHNVWLLGLKYRGEDVYHRLKEWVDIVSEPYLEYVTKHLKGVDYQISPAAINIYKHFGLFPVGDTTRASQPHMWKWHVSEEVEKSYFGPIKGRDSIQGFKDKMDERQVILDKLHAAYHQNGSLDGIFPTRYSEWQVVDIISSIVSDQPSIQIVNIPNNGSINGLPDDLIVEVPATITGDGARSNIKKVSFPKKVMDEAIIPHSLQIERHVEAYRTKDKNLLLEQIQANHVVSDIKVARKILKIWEENDSEMAKFYNNRISSK
jgi:alpha-galactosidase